MRFVALSLVLALVAAACGGGETRPTNSAPAPDADTVAGMLVASDVDRADPDAPATDVGAVSAGLQGFAAHLYGSLSGPEGNLVFSPVSISTALAMAYAGAAGTTAEEMAAVLGNPLTAEEFHAAINVLDQAIESRNRAATEQEGGVEISIANSLWGQDGMVFRDAFLDLLALDYGAGMRVVDFIDPAAREEARLTINDWVSGETNDRIEDLLGEGVLDELVRLVLVNAVYLNAAWLMPFDEAGTVEAPFTLLDGSEVSVPIMHTDASMPVGRGDGWQALQIPYAGGELAMLVILPDEGSFAQVEASLSDGLIDQVVESLSPDQVILALPKFEIRTQLGLVPALQAIGLREATSAAADFTGMTGSKDLYISDVVHEAWISADEAGTEAAAATAVVMSLTAAPMEPVPFVVDRPFLFVLRDATTGLILFMGRVVDPSG
ncbi:MAG: serpin family protein [Acidimicrobiia bacterium]|nr:serpin family protein [Acidimicrobiia bacterium]